MNWIHMQNFVVAQEICKNYFYYLKKGQPTELKSLTCKTLLMHKNFQLNKSAVGITRHAIWNGACKACNCTGFFTEIFELL